MGLAKPTIGLVGKWSWGCPSTVGCRRVSFSAGAAASSRSASAASSAAAAASSSSLSGSATATPEIRRIAAARRLSGSSPVVDVAAPSTPGKPSPGPGLSASGPGRLRPLAHERV